MKHKRYFKVIAILTIIMFVSSCYYGRFSRNRDYNRGSSSSSSSRTPSKTTSSPKSSEYVKPIAKKAPQGFTIALIIDEWVIKEHKILRYSNDLGKIEFSGKYLYGGKLVFRFISSNIRDYYWLAEMPSERKGRYTVKAFPYRKYSIDIEPLPTPPNGFSAYMESQNREIVKFDIMDYRTRWGKFKVRNVEGSVMYMVNAWYPGALWAARLPRANSGKFTLKFKKIE